MADDKSVTIVIKGKNLTDAEFAAARKNLAGLTDASKHSSSGMGLLGGTMKTAIGTMGGFISAQAIMSGVSSAFSFAKGAAIDMNATLEKSTLQFGTLMGDSQRAEKHVRDLFEFAKKTPFETGPIIAASKSMQTFGGDALNTMANLTLLGDASAATGAPIEDLGFWVGRMYAALKGGQPVGEATMRLMELGVMTPQTRVQMEGLAKSAGGGEKAFKLFQESLGGFSGAMVAQANTWDGLMSSISDAVNITLADSLKPFFELVKEGAQIALKVLGSEGVAKAFTSLKDSIGFSLGGDTSGLIKSFVSGVLTVGDAFLATAGIGERVFTFALNIIRTAVYGLITTFFQLGGGVVSTFATIAEGASKLPGVGDQFKGVSQSLRGMSDWLKSNEEGFRGLMGESLKASVQQSALNKAIDGSRTILQAVRGEVDSYTKATITSTVATKKQGDAMNGVGGANGAANNYIAQLMAAQRQVASLTTAQQAQIAAGLKVGASEKELAKAVGLSEAAIRLYKEQLADTAAWTKKVDDATLSLGEAISKGLFGKLTTDVGPTPALFTKSFLSMLQPLPKAVKASGVPVSLAEALFSGFTGKSGVFAGLGDTIVKAFQGGGNVLKSIGGTIGAQLGTNAVSHFGKSITGLLGQTLGGALNSILPGVGALLGPLMGKIGGFFKGLFGGVSKDVQEARQTVEQFQVSLHKTLTAQQRTEAGGEKWKMTVIAVRDAYLATGRSASEAEAIVRKLWDTDRPERAKAAIEEINRVLGIQTSTQEETNRAIEKYGFTADELGPRMRQQRLSEQANQLARDWQLVTAAEIDANVAATRMSAATNEYLAIALRTGAEVPASMKPMLEKMLEMGLLTDQNGEKLTSLEGLTWAETLTQGFDRVVGAIDRIVDAINGIPRNVDVNVNGRWNPPDLPGDDNDLPGFAHGTREIAGTWFPDFGGGTPVIAHHREAIVPFEQRFDFAADVLRAAGASRQAPTVTMPPVNIYIAVDQRGARQVSETEYLLEVVQNGLKEGRIRVPQRAISGRAA